MSAAAAAVQTRVLIVEDDPSTCDMLQRACARRKIPCDCAMTVGEALVLLERETSPSHLILDINLPDANGSLLIRRIRREQLHTNIAIVTGVADPSVYEHLLERPHDTLLPKPIRLNELFDWLAQE